MDIFKHQIFNNGRIGSDNRFEKTSIHLRKGIFDINIEIRNLVICAIEFTQEILDRSPVAFAGATDRTQVQIFGNLERETRTRIIH